jgi:hypothetical protein
MHSWTKDSVSGSVVEVLLIAVVNVTFTAVMRRQIPDAMEAAVVLC